MNHAATVIEQLRHERPRLHGEVGGHQWGLATTVLRWISDHVRVGEATIETGCGYSTLVFAAAGCRHVVISPVSAEHARIREWGGQHGIDFSQVTFIADKAEVVLPTLDTPPLACALIDGWHAFPGPFLDWFFISQRLVVDGYVMVDDVQIRACGILRDFLNSEHGRWQPCGQVGRTAIFKKLTSELFVGDWNSQPYGATPKLSMPEQAYRSLCSPFIRMAKRIPGVPGIIDRVRPLIKRT